MTWYEGLDALPEIRFDAARIESQSTGATGIEAPLSTGARTATHGKRQRRIGSLPRLDLGWVRSRELALQSRYQR